MMMHGTMNVKIDSNMPKTKPHISFYAKLQHCTCEQRELMQGEERNCHYNKQIIIYTPFRVLRNSKTEFNNNAAPNNYLFRTQ
jgi:hypothetical protein